MKPFLFTLIVTAAFVALCIHALEKYPPTHKQDIGEFTAQKLAEHSQRCSDLTSGEAQWRCLLTWAAEEHPTKRRGK